MYCPKCGASINSGTKFCGSCGNDLSASNQTNEVTPVAETTNQPVNNVTNLNQTEQPQMVAQPQIIEQPVAVEQPIVQNAQPQFSNQQAAVPSQEPAYVQPGLNAQPPQKSSGSKTVIFVIISVIILVAVAIGISFLLPDSKEKKEKEKIEQQFASDKPIPVKKADKYGYINTKGEFVIDAKYEAANEFIGEYAVVREMTEIEGIKQTQYAIINTKGKSVKTSIGPVEYIESDNKWIIDYALYDENMKQLSPKGTRVGDGEDGYYIWVSQDGKTGGIMNSKGKKTYTYTFQTGESYINFDVSDNDETLKEKYCVMNIENDKYAVVNCDTGTVVLDYTTQYISDEDDNIFDISKEGSFSTEYYIYVQNDKIAYKTPIDGDVSLNYYPGYVQIRDYDKPYSDRYTYLPTDTLTEQKEQPTSTSEEKEENEWEKLTKNKTFTCSEGYGLMNGEKITLPCEYDSIKYLELDLYKYLKSNKKDYVYARKDGKWYVIDLNTKASVYEFKTSYIYPQEKTSFMYYTHSETKKTVIFNILTGKSLAIENNAYDYYHSNYVRIKDYDAKTVKFYNTDLELIYTESNE